jgi:hypothetical protein
VLVTDRVELTVVVTLRVLRGLGVGIVVRVGEPEEDRETAAERDPLEDFEPVADPDVDTETLALAVWVTLPEDVFDGLRDADWLRTADPVAAELLDAIEDRDADVVAELERLLAADGEPVPLFELVRVAEAVFFDDGTAVPVRVAESVLGAEGDAVEVRVWVTLRLTVEVRELDQLGRGVAEVLTERVAAADRSEERDAVEEAVADRLAEADLLVVGEALCVRDSRALRLPEAVVVPDLEMVEVPVVVRVAVVVRDSFEVVVVVRVVVEVLEDVPEADADLDAVADFVEVALVVLVLDRAAVRVAVGVGRVVKLERALLVDVRVDVAEAVGRAPKMRNSRGASPASNVMMLSPTSG